MAKLGSIWLTYKCQVLTVLVLHLNEVTSRWFIADIPLQMNMLGTFTLGRIHDISFACQIEHLPLNITEVH